MNQRQQGTVGVRFMVTPEGRVRDTTVAAPSPWPVLDESALRTIRHRWRFPRGPVRVYEVAIRFALAP
jgi:TonB family protein